MPSVLNLPIEVITDHKCLLAEGPVWDAKKNAILWIDILKGHIHEHSFKTSSQKTIELKEMIGSLSICSDRNLITALQNGFAFVDRESGKKTMIVDPESDLPNNRFNDGKCDPAGRFWAGTMSLSEDKGAGSLYVLNHNLTCSKKINGVTISNGLAWASDHNTMYYIDTPTLQIVAYDYNKSTGEIINRRVVITIDEKEGYPDGMTIDNEDMLWIAHWNGWQVTRWNPKTGKQLLAVKMPVAKVTSCTFGGENLTDLYITSAKVDLSQEDLKSQPLAGSLFVIKDIGYKGVAAFEFKRS